MLFFACVLFLYCLMCGISGVILSTVVKSVESASQPLQPPGWVKGPSTLKNKTHAAKCTSNDMTRCG